MSADDRSWVGGVVNDGIHPGEAAIFRSTPDGTWTRQNLPMDRPAIVNTLHFRDSALGFAGGHVVGGGSEAFILHTSSGGSSWERSRLPADLQSYRVTSIVRTGARSGWAVASYSYSPRVVLLATEDGGESWTEVPSDVGDDCSIWSLEVLGANPG